MVRVSYDQKPYRRAMMETFGAFVTASPSNETEFGRAILAQTPQSNGSLGIAISEAIEVAAKDPETKYALGSVLNHVLLHQTVIGLETIEQTALADNESDVIVGCGGGGVEFRRSGDAVSWPQDQEPKSGASHCRRTRGLS